jgi:hypothetical protein
MLDRWESLLRIFGILVVLSFTFLICQPVLSQPDKTSGDTSPAESNTTSGNVSLAPSGIVTIIQEINASEQRIIKEINTVKIDVAVLKTRINFVQWVIGIIGIPVLIYLAILGIQKLTSRGGESAVSPQSSQPQDVKGGKLTDATRSKYQDIRKAA